MHQFPLPVAAISINCISVKFNAKQPQIAATSTMPMKTIDYRPKMFPLYATRSHLFSGQLVCTNFRFRSPLYQRQIQCKPATDCRYLDDADENDRQPSESASAMRN